MKRSESLQTDGGRTHQCILQKVGKSILCINNNKIHSEDKLKNIVYIHGAHSSSVSFNYLKMGLPAHNALMLDYRVDVPFMENEDRFEREIAARFKDQSYSIIAHSLGGLHAAKIMLRCNHAESAVTIAAPYGGSQFADYLRWFAPQYQLFKDIRVTSPVIKSLKGFKISKPYLQIVTTGGGNPLMQEDNDGTVTKQSQLALGVQHVELHLNHFEALLSEKTVELTKHHLYK